MRDGARVLVRRTHQATPPWRRFLPALAACPMLMATLVATVAASARPSRACDACAVLPRPDLRVKMTIASHGVRIDSAGVRAIVDRIWNAEGLSIAWQDGVGSDGVDAWILIGHGPADNHDPTAIGGILFGPDGVPNRLLRLSIDAASAWALAGEASRFQTATVFRNLTLGQADVQMQRVLGYAAAHELGHFVLASKTHASSGLMKARVTRDEPLDPRALRLDQSSRRRLRDRLATSAACR
jgi:hypothetical protein